jgi:hypothetical protein
MSNPNTLAYSNIIVVRLEVGVSLCFTRFVNNFNGNLRRLFFYFASDAVSLRRRLVGRCSPCIQITHALLPGPQARSCSRFRRPI